MSSTPYKEIESISELPAPDSSGFITHYVFQYIDFNLVPQYVAAGHRFTDCCFLGCEIPAEMEDEIGRTFENLNKYLVSKGIPCIMGEYGCTAIQAETEIAKQAACYISNASKYDIACFYWMSLSDGEDRSVPKWTRPTLKNAILNAYNGNKNN